MKRRIFLQSLVGLFIAPLAAKAASKPVAPEFFWFDSFNPATCLLGIYSLDLVDGQRKWRYEPAPGMRISYCPGPLRPAGTYVGDWRIER